MTWVSEIAEHWFGLCRKPPVVHASQTASVHLPEPAHAGSPEGGGGGSGTIRWGIGAALSGTKTLVQNRQLLWFTLLVGLVLAGNTIGQAALFYIGWAMHPGIIVSYVLDFSLELATLFCLVFLLAGLVLSIPSKKEGSALFFRGIAGAKKYVKALFVWSVVLALAGMLLFRIWVYFSSGLPPEIRFLTIFGLGDLTSILAQFPFNLTLDPNLFTGVPGYGGRSLLLWIYPLGFMWALIFSAINLLLFILTPFVVPSLVLEQKTLRAAVTGSFTLLKKTWVEVAACAAFLGAVVSGVFLTYLLVQAAHGYNDPWMAWPPGMVTSHPTGTWIALGLLYYLAVFIVAFVVATVGGIAALDLYTSATTGQKPGSAKTELP
ncbi:hypothetical protein [Methanoregula sp.]|uniref:hypothetical protein n=1 Tax=Methanoregula sp. TaxID=2052170 RepID=UPI002C87BCD6|nr:hypothetical protein [Methanoregula sp.]HVP95733.1 hypothetical protein [Methanoregula sp.]